MGKGIGKERAVPYKELWVFMSKQAEKEPKGTLQVAIPIEERHSFFPAVGE